MRDLDDEISKYEATLGYDIKRYTLFGKTTTSFQSKMEKFACLRRQITRDTQAFADRINEFASKFRLDDDDDDVIEQNSREESEHPRIEHIRSTVEEFLVLQLVLVQKLVSIRKVAFAKIFVAEIKNDGSEDGAACVSSNAPHRVDTNAASSPVEDETRKPAANTVTDEDLLAAFKFAPNPAVSILDDMS
jgi:hypothetical protein